MKIFFPSLETKLHLGITGVSREPPHSPPAERQCSLLGTTVLLLSWKSSHKFSQHVFSFCTGKDTTSLQKKKQHVPKGHTPPVTPKLNRTGTSVPARPPREEYNRASTKRYLLQQITARVCPKPEVVSFP